MKVIRNVMLILLGNAILAFGIVTFSVPVHLIIGGVTGLSLIGEHCTGIHYSYLVYIFNIGFFILGYFYLGKKFAMGTLLSTITFPFFISFFETFRFLKTISNDMLLCCIYAGVCTGVGLGIVFRIGYSTGGMDIPPLIIHKKTGISVSTLINIFDIAILLAQMWFNSVEGILYGSITVFISNYILDRMMFLGEKNYQVFVISPMYEAITNKIYEMIDRGVTYVEIETSYLHLDQKAVLCVVSQRELHRITELVLEIDSHAFLISNEIHSVKGRGFSLPNIDINKNEI